MVLPGIAAWKRCSAFTSGVFEMQPFIAGIVLWFIIRRYLFGRWVY